MEMTQLLEGERIGTSADSEVVSQIELLSSMAKALPSIQNRVVSSFSMKS